MATCLAQVRAKRCLHDGCKWPTQPNEAYSLNQQVTRIDEDGNFFLQSIVCLSLPTLLSPWSEVSVAQHILLS